MSATATITTVKANLADGQVAAQFKVSIIMADLTGSQVKMVDGIPVLDANGNETGDVVCPSVTFDDLAPGSYTVLASRVDQTGADIVTAVSNTFTVAPPAPPVGGTPAQADVPASVTVTVS
jgi:hypothetical protein